MNHLIDILYSALACAGNKTRQTVSREVRFFAMHEDFEPAASDWVIAHENSGCDVTIEFEELK